jgi:3-oxoacyl-[acyl-carrier protein] reductase
MTAIDLSGKVALVTGGSRGIGRAISTRLYAAGAHVAIVDRTGEHGPALAAALTGRGRAAAYQMEISHADEVERVVADAERELGSIDLLINNAGTTQDALLLRMGEEAWDRIVDVNLKGAFLTTKLVTRGMLKRRWGRVVNISSVVGISGNPGQANYVAAKAGLIGFTKAVARELASRNILVNAVAPGFIDTDLTRGLPEAVQKELLGKIPVGRFGQADEVASVVLFLVSDWADYITGQVLVVDGGMVM